MFRKYDQNVRKAIKKGVYNPDAEHDACGIGFVANIKNIKTNNIVQDGLSILKNLTHRGAVGADPRAGDGCGCLAAHFWLTQYRKMSFPLYCDIIKTA